jgi:hypothetical protein
MDASIGTGEAGVGRGAVGIEDYQDGCWRKTSTAGDQGDDDGEVEAIGSCQIRSKRDGDHPRRAARTGQAFRETTIPFPSQEEVREVRNGGALPEGRASSDLVNCAG